MAVVPYPEREAITEIALPDLRLLTERDIPAALALRDVLWETADDDNVKVIVLRAATPDFCPPPARTDRTTRPPSTAFRAAFTSVHDAYFGATSVYQTLCFCKKVVIAEVQGACAGAGALISLYADLTVAADDALFYPPLPDLPETNLAMMVLAMRLHRAKAWVLNGAPLPAEDARAAGLVNAVVSRRDLHDAALALARRAAAMPLDAIVMSKLAMQVFLDTQGVDSEFDSASFHEAAHQLAMRE